MYSPSRIAHSSCTMWLSILHDYESSSDIRAISGWTLCLAEASWIYSREEQHFHSLSHIKCRAGWFPSLFTSQAYWLVNFSKGSPCKMNGCAVLMLLSWDCYTRSIKWVNRQWKNHSCTFLAATLFLRRKIYQVKNDVQHWFCAVPPVWPLYVTRCDSIM